MDEEDFSAYPQELTIAVTDRCNMRCAICNRDWYEEFIGGKGSFLPLENLDKILGAVARAEVVGLTGFGEPRAAPGGAGLPLLRGRPGRRPREGHRLLRPGSGAGTVTHRLRGCRPPL